MSTAFFMLSPSVDFILRIILTNFALWHEFWLLITDGNAVESQ